MSNRYEEVAVLLLKLVEREMKVYQDLTHKTNVNTGYHPELESIHLKNAEKLEEIIYEVGWPTVEKVGEEAAYAAILILEHAISKPSFQRKCLEVFRSLASKNQHYLKDVAMLYDRICFFEMRPQKYGTQFDFDENNILSPWKIEDSNLVDHYRSEVHLPPLEEAVQKMRELSTHIEPPTTSYEERLREREKWAKKVGWI